MILTEKTGTVIASNDVTSSGFRIKASRKAFEILSAGLYSDKVRAIIRELSTNAMDAHIASGKPTLPFVVHLPNQMEPWFEVRDFGTGLSDKAMMTVYTTYFESDKTDSNDVTGCLGLGSKSPFSYTDSFTVESRFDGVKSIYTAFLDGQGMPSISKMQSEPTDEPNGLTVKFPVKSGDFYAFKEKAAVVLAFFRVQPTVTGAQIIFPKREYLRNTDKFGVSLNRTGRSYAIMGNVAYPIEPYEFLNSYNEEAKLKNLVEWGVELYVNIGDVDIAASREKLSYDKPTVRFLKESLKEALADLEKEITKEISGMPTIWQARRKLHEVRKSFQGFDFLAEYNGEKINDYVNIGVKEVNGVDVAVASVERLRIKSGRHSDRLVIKKERVDRIHADGSDIFLNDARGAYAAVRRYLAAENDHNANVYLVSDADAEWLTKTGVSETAIKTSTLPKPERGSGNCGERGRASKAKVFEFVPNGNSDNGSSSASRYWTPAEVDVDEDDGIFVEILYFNYRFAEGQATIHPNGLNRFLEMIQSLTGKSPTIYGIRPADKGMIEAAEGSWTEFKDFLNEVATNAEVQYGEDYLKARRLARMGMDYYHRRPDADVFSKTKFSDGSVFGEYVKEVLDAQRASERVSKTKYQELRGYLNMEDKNDNNVDALDVLKEKVFAKYPLLAHLNNSQSSEECRDAIIAYVNMIDK
jgi:hypothetical protein